MAMACWLLADTSAEHPRTQVVFGNFLMAVKTAASARLRSELGETKERGEWNGRQAERGEDEQTFDEKDCGEHGTSLQLR